MDNPLRTGSLVLLLLVLSQPAATNHPFYQDQYSTRKPQIHRRNEHNELYKGYGSYNLRELAAKAKEGEEVALSQVCAMTVEMPEAPPFSLGNFLVGLACQADAIVSGVIIDQASFLTEDERYVFTDYTLKVDGIFKDDLAAPIETHREIVFTRPCGTIILGGRRVRVTDVTVRLFDQGGRYILFLKRVPNTGTYSALRRDSGFEVRDGQVFKTTEVFFGMESETDASYFLNELRVAAGNPCKGSQRE